MFKWQSKKIQKEEGAQSKSESEQIIIKRCIAHIQTLVGVTQADFQKLYVEAIKRFIDYITGPNGPIDEELVTEKLSQVVLALKKRRGYLLPLGADSETSFRETEEWTYAVFSAALMKGILGARLDLAKALIPSEGFAWLHRNEKLFILWEAYLSGKDHQTVFDQIIGRLEDSQDDNPLANQETALSEISTPEKPLESSSAVLKKSLPKDTVIQEINLHQESEIVKDDEALKIQAAVKRTIPEWTARQFFNWLKSSIMNDHIKINEPTSFIHRVKEGILILIPQTLEYFLEEQMKILNIPAEQMGKQLIVLTKVIKKHDGLVRNEQGARIHSYCLGKWEDRNVLSGIVVRLETLFDTQDAQPINNQLSIDPMSNT